MKRFSERLGIVESIPLLQTDGMTEALRNSLWNYLHSLFENNKYNNWIPLAKWTAQLFRKVPVDDVPYEDFRCRNWMKDYFFGLAWHEVYDLVEFIVEHYRKIVPYPDHDRQQLERTFNGILQMEQSGYRFIAGMLAPISNPAETTEISGAVEMTARAGLDGAHKHLQTALALLAKKPEPDYRNSIKESISAVESVARLLGRENSQGLTATLDELSKKVQIHGALKAGFVKLYGYTSDEDGIRHAILDEPSVGFDEAKYMIVSCSAFVNYLISKAQAGGLLEKG